MSDFSSLTAGYDDAATCCIKNHGADGRTLGLALRVVAHELRATGKSATLGRLHEGHAATPPPKRRPWWSWTLGVVLFVAGLAVGIAL